MHSPIKYLEKGLAVAANGEWSVFNTVNHQPWPVLHSQVVRKTAAEVVAENQPPLGSPRKTDSLCPVCVREARHGDSRRQTGRLHPAAREGRRDPATILERDGKILMVKDLPTHGHFEDVMAMDTDFFKHLDRCFPVETSPRTTTRSCTTTAAARSTRPRKVLTVNLTNSCDIMCDPCFMDANQVGFVHELSWEDIKQVLDNAITIKPRRQMSVQFSGGEPTMSPYFLDAVRYAREVGYNSVQAATNGIEFAKSPEFAKAAAEAGLRYAYLQFDGIGNAGARIAASATCSTSSCQPLRTCGTTASTSFRS